MRITKKMLFENNRDLTYLFYLVLVVCTIVSIAVVVQLKDLQTKTETVLENQNVIIRNTDRLINILTLGE